MAMAKRRRRAVDGDEVVEGLSHPYPSSPRRLPTHYVSITCGKRYHSETFSAAYAARAFVDHVVGDQAYKWLSHTKIRTEEDVIVESPQLEDIIEHDLTPAEKEWSISDEDKRTIFYVVTGRRLRIRPFNDKKMYESVADPKRVVQTIRDNPMGPSFAISKPNGLVSIGDICARIGMDPSKARRTLRASTQLAHQARGRWAWPDSEVDAIIKILKK
jgi:hypothetical protein